MRILITNDDGVLAPVLPHLIRWARQYGEVVAVAPKVEQSGKSHAIDFTHPLEIKKVSIGAEIGEDITVTVVSVDNNRVRLAISAPNSVSILRSELVAARQVNQDSAAEGAAPQALLSLFEQP